MFWMIGAIGFAFHPFDEGKVYAQMASEYRKIRLLERNPKIPKEAYQKASRGEIATGIEKVEGKDAHIGWGVAIVNIPLAHFFASVNEEENHVPHTAVSFAKVVRGAPCADGREVLMTLPLPIIADRWWITHQYTNPELRKQSQGQAAELVWEEIADWKIPNVYQKRLQGMIQIPFTQGSWFLLALDEQHTLAEYHSWVDPGGNIPAGPASQFAMGSIEETFLQMESFAQRQDRSLCASIWK